MLKVALDLAFSEMHFLVTLFFKRDMILTFKPSQSIIIIQHTAGLWESKPTDACSHMRL